MDHFYKLKLLGIVHKHLGHTIAKRFFCPGWKTVDESLIQQTTIENEYLVPNTRESGVFYVVNSVIGTCSCFVGITGTPCKHQGAVSVKFHIPNFNFLPSLTPNDRIVYSYIAI